MRLTGGRMKGRKVCHRGVGGASVHGVLRPTPAKVRESVFNIIGPRMDGAVFVDLYAGSGAVGMEAMSRGAERVYFIEADQDRAVSLNQTLEGCGCQSNAVIVNMTAADFIRKHYVDRTWDVVFLDPPYSSGEYDEVLPLLEQSAHINADTLIVAEHATRNPLPDRVGRLTVKKTYRYGDTSLSVYSSEDR